MKMTEGNAFDTSAQVQADARIFSECTREYFAEPTEQKLNHMVAKFNERPALIKFLTRDRTGEEIQKLQTEEVRHLYKHRMEMLDIACNFQINSMRTKSSAMLRELAAGLVDVDLAIHTRLTKSIEEKIEEMNFFFDERRTKVRKRIESLEKDCAECVNIPYLHERYKRNIELEANAFFDRIEEAAKVFPDTIHNMFRVALAGTGYQMIGQQS
jgi:DNA-binding transcriptional MerR regulator